MKISNTEIVNWMLSEEIISKNFKFEYLLDQIDGGRTTEDEQEELTGTEVQELLNTIRFGFINELEAKDII